VSILFLSPCSIVSIESPFSAGSSIAMKSGLCVSSLSFIHSVFIFVSLSYGLCKRFSELDLRFISEVLYVSIFFCFIVLLLVCLFGVFRFRVFYGCFVENSL
jgi:hypothetical protein